MPWLVRRGVELEGNDWRQPRSSGRRIWLPPRCADKRATIFHPAQSSGAMAWRGNLFAGICPRVGASAESYAEREGHWADRSRALPPCGMAQNFPRLLWIETRPVIGQATSHYSTVESPRAIPSSNPLSPCPLPLSPSHLPALTPAKSVREA
jgi:hypothetical protein